MVTNMKFGECLRYLLSILDISIVKLSKIINVDNSLVNRWVNEKRIPSYNTNYVDKISEYLSGCILNSFQMQYIDALFLKVCGESKVEISPKEKIKKALLQSQGYSIECRKAIIKENKTHLVSNNKILKSTDFYQRYSKQSDNTHANLLNTQDSDFLINLSSKDKIVIGYKNVLAASISLLNDTSSHKCNNDVIHISFNNNMFTPDYHSDLINFRDSILKAINNGWNIIFLLKLNSSIYNVANFIDFARPLISTGKFHPYYFKKYNSFSTYQEFIIVPNIGMLLGLPNNSNSEIDTAFYFRNNVAINIFSNRIDSLVANHTNSLIKYYEPDNAIDYSNFLTEQENIIGNRILYKRDFSILIFPENLYEKLLKRKNLNDDEINISLEFYKRRLEAFLSNIHNYKYTDIYHIDCINNLIKYRKLYLYSHVKVSMINLEFEDVIDILKNIVTLLEKYNNYNISFISEHSNILDFVFYCMVKERTAVLIEIYDYSKDMPVVRLSTKEPIIVNAFEAYLNETLEQVPSINKDKNEIVNWIQCQIDSIKNYG